MPNQDLIVRVLLDPGLISSLNIVEWDLLIRQARRSNLLGKLAFRLEKLQKLDNVPLAPKQHLLSALKIANRQALAIEREVSCISAAMRDCGASAILLKGAAYVVGRVSAAPGRTFADVDILVPKAQILAVESALMIHGWLGAHHDEYDQRYYRKWMHEIPPMAHMRRGTTIDVHHTILPETARLKVNVNALMRNPLPVDGYENIFILGPIDMVIHSATHLFHEGELDNGLRDLFDLDSLIRQFGVEDGFWRDLIPRAKELGLERPLYYALRYLQDFLATPVPVAVAIAIERGAPTPLVKRLIDACYRRALRPNHLSCHSRGAWLARKMLYIRSHWIRMPMHLLIFHLGYKAFIHKGNENTGVVADQKQP